MPSARFILLLLSLSVFYFVWYFSYTNGLRQAGEAVFLAKTLPLPLPLPGDGGGDGTQHVPLRQTYTGVAPLDRLLVQLTIFFWPVSDGSQPELVLHSIAFSGTFSSAWLLVSLESWRGGSRGTAAAYPAVLGLLAQILTFAFSAPLYGFLHLSRSATASNPTRDNMRIPHGVVRAIPAVFTLGMFVPSMAMMAPPSHLITPDVKQILIAIWQPWPAYVAVLLVAAHRSTDRASASSLRLAYAYAFGSTAATHLVALVISCAAAAVPGIFRPEYARALHPRSVFALALPWAALPFDTTTVGQGVHVFLRWDYAIGSTGVLIWAASLYCAAHRAAAIDVRVPHLLAKMAVLSAVVSPVGAAVELMWEREELFLRDSPEQTALRAHQEKNK